MYLWIQIHPLVPFHCANSTVYKSGHIYCLVHHQPGTLSPVKTLLQVNAMIDACNRVSSNMADKSEIMHTWGIKVRFNKINVRGTPQLFSVKDLLGEANIA